MRLVGGETGSVMVVMVIEVPEDGGGEGVKGGRMDGITDMVP
jgi:hypothetical protein